MYTVWKGPHSLLDCPSKDVVGHKCLCRGHYVASCFSKTRVDVIDTNAGQDTSGKDTTPSQEDAGDSDSSGYMSTETTGDVGHPRFCQFVDRPITVEIVR